jgi:hypothetical protein
MRPACLDTGETIGTRKGDQQIGDDTQRQLLVSAGTFGPEGVRAH